jgi:aryl-alcohol dehydrogenase-like predicted oxidoreductase
MPADSTSSVRWSPIGLGTGRLASLGRGTSLSDVRSLLAAMEGTGVTVIDTADSYTSGRCEELIGSGIKGRRDGFVLVTKAGYRYGDLPFPLRPLNPFIKKFWQLTSRSQCHRADYLRRSLERSLQRLGTDRVDAFLLHDPPLPTIRDERVLQTLGNLQQEGKILRAGLSSDKPEVIAAALEAGIFRVLQSPVNPQTTTILSPLWRKAEARGLHLMANHVFFSGNTAGYHPTAGKGLHETLLRHARNSIRQGTILVGTRNPEHLRQCVSWSLDSTGDPP